MSETPEVIRGRIQRRRWLPVLGAASAGFLVGTLVLAICLWRLSAAGAPLGLLAGLGSGLATTGLVLVAILGTWRLRTAHDLVRHGFGHDALPLLKQLEGQGSAHQRDTACYLTARAYHVEGATKLALAYYRDYPKRFPEGAWLIETKTHARDLRREVRERNKVALKAREETSLRCPYCRDALLVEKPHVECDSCGTRYHEDCHAERGGCSVLGCAKAPQAESVPA